MDRVVRLSMALLTFTAAAYSPQSAHAAELVTDESVKLRVLKLVFPNARISVLPKHPDEKSYPVKDPLNRVIALRSNGLAHGPEYEVIGPVTKNEEDPASNITDYGHPSDKRKVQMQLYRWKVAEGEPVLVAVLSYSFLDANPPRCCQAVGKVLLLSSTADRILDVLNKVPYAFTMFTDIRFLQVGGPSPEKLMIAADYSGVATVGVSSVVLDVSGKRLKPLMSIPTFVLYEAELENADVHTLTLDKHRTLVAGGERFFFVKKSYVEKGKVLKTPATSSVSYPVGAGLPLDWQ